MLSKDFLGKKIESISNQNFWKEYQQIIDFVDEHPFARQIKFVIWHKEKPIKMSFHELVTEMRYTGYTDNFHEVEAKRKEVLEEKELNRVLEKVESINYLFNQE